LVEVIEDHLKSKSNLEIDGILFIVEDISYSNTLPKRKMNRQKIINGTEIVSRGEYTPKEFEVTTTLRVPADRPDIYSDAFNELQADIREVVSPLMGTFRAELTINYEITTPTSIKVKIKIMEVPDEKSGIPGEDMFTIPEDKLESEEHKAERLKQKEDKKNAKKLVKEAKESYSEND
jgi:hypothetical protein